MSYRSPESPSTPSAGREHKYNPGQSFAEQGERVSEAGRKGQGAVPGNMKHDPGRAAEAGHRSNEQRPASGDHRKARARS